MKVFHFKDVFLLITWILLIFLGRLAGTFVDNRDELVRLNNALTIIFLYCIPLILSISYGIVCLRRNSGYLLTFVRTSLVNGSGFLCLWLLYVMSEKHLFQKHWSHALIGGIVFATIGSSICGGLSMLVYGIAKGFKDKV